MFPKKTQTKNNKKPHPRKPTPKKPNPQPTKPLSWKLAKRISVFVGVVCVHALFIFAFFFILLEPLFLDESSLFCN